VTLIRFMVEGKAGRFEKGGGEWGGNQERTRLLVLSRSVGQTLGFVLIRTRVTITITTKNTSRT
jgi:hypothetical protein